jgi:hypothetical protein
MFGVRLGLFSFERKCSVGQDDIARIIWVWLYAPEGFFAASISHAA